MTDTLYGQSQAEAELERLVDCYGLANVLRLLSNLCVEKAGHVLENWQDVSLARRWETAAKLVDNTAAKIGESV